jgi:nucleoside-diphosphate-sugar epimerase
MSSFLAGLPAPHAPHQVADFKNFPDHVYDLVINCVGFGSPQTLQDNLANIFRITTSFDDLVLDYLSGHPQTLYINLSSGAAYGLDFSHPVDEQSPARFNLNNLQAEEFYGIAKLHSEARHRALPRLNIVDLRIFGYFSRHINLTGKSLLSEIISCLENRQVLVTNPVNIQRDFLHPQDLVALIDSCLSHCPLNTSYDAYSRKGISKFELLDFFAGAYGLEYKIDSSHQALTVTGQKNHYYPTGRKAEKIGYSPSNSSLEGISVEAAAILLRQVKSSYLT